MITVDDFQRIRAALGQQAEDDIDWTMECRAPVNPDFFASEAIFVICNSGMKNTVARRIFARCTDALAKRQPVSEVFGHKGKAGAIESIWRNRHDLFLGYCKSTDRLAFLESLPWIGAITKFHLAKNFGLQLAKPDVHLQRLADREGCTAQLLCERLASETGLSVAAIDTVLWRACANGVLDSRTGELRA